MAELLKSEPLVSVVMCTYNGEKFLDEQLESIVNQTYKNVEILIVDDVSTDNTKNIIQNWIKKDPRIYFHQNQVNLGYNRNFEKAISLATGEFIALSDQDDVWYLHKIEHLLSLFSSDDIVLVHARSVEMINGELKYPVGKQLPPFGGDDPKKLFYDNQIGGHKIMFRKRLVPKISPIPDNMFYDWWIGVLAACNGRIKGTEEYLVKYRIHGENSHINVKKEVKDKHIDHITAWKYFIQIPDMKRADKEYLANLISIFENHRREKKLFDNQLFFYLLKNKRILLSNRRKLATDFLHLKFIYYYLITKF